MDKYIYYAAQLPMLVFDQEPAIGIGAFLTEGQKWMSSCDYQILTAVSIYATTPQKDDLPVYRAYQLFENALRRELLQYRQALKSRQEHKPRLFPPAVLKEGNPLEVEKKLLRMRWQLLDEMEFGHYSDMAFFILYHLKLQILVRLSSFDKERGKEKFLTYTELTYEQD